MTSARLIWVAPNAEITMGYCARVSNPANQDNPDVTKLLRHCIKKGHWSVFEMANMCVEINTSIAISRQILRHDFNFQEFSQRYSEVMSIEPIELRRQDHKNRQNSIDDLPKNVSESLSRDINDLMMQTKSLYQKLISHDVAKECARMILPMASSTRLYASATVRDWCHYLKLRSGNGTQKEHVEVAEAIMPIFAENFPLTTRAFFE
mgnify:CR=1 FL=1